MPIAGPPFKSPLKLAIGLSLAIAAGAVLSTLDTAIFDPITSGKWLTRSFSEAQERNTASIAALGQSVGAVTQDIDFVAARVSASIRRNEDLARERFAEIDARIAALKERLAARPADSSPAGPANTNDVTGLRSSLHELAAAHNGAVSAITRRLDRIEVMVGISTDVISSASNPAARRSARRNAVAAKKQAAQAEAAAPQSLARPERGHIFNLKPVSQRGLLRLSRLPD